MFDALNKRCKLGDLTNYISNASNVQNVIRSIPAYDSVLGKRQEVTRAEVIFLPKNFNLKYFQKLMRFQLLLH